MGLLKSILIRIRPMQAIEFNLDKLTLAGLRTGEETAPVILCLHGWLDNAASFTPLFEQLEQEDSPLLKQFNFIAIDWIGHGLSSHRGLDSHYHFVDWVYDLLLLIESQGWDQVNIIGHSMGGMIATAFTSAFNEKVNKLMLIESIGLITLNENPSEQLRNGMLSRLKFQKKQKSTHKTLDSAVKARMGVSDLPNHCAHLLVERSLHKVEGGVTWRSDPRLRNISPQRYALKQAIQIVANIHCPVLLILGDTGFDMIQAGLKVFGEHLEDLTHHTIDGGHHPHMESPSDVIKFIKNYF